ncbi:MAG: NTP transferase domain-containing protein [Terriglobales bacterium]
MARSPSFCGVILAAGESSRMGRDKGLLPWPPGPAGRSTFLSATIELLQAPSDLVIVVAGKNAESLRPIVDAAAGYLVENPHPERGQFSSLQVGLQEVLNHGRDAAMVALVDRPPAQPATLAQLCEAFRHAYESGKWAVVPEHGGRHGHPILIGREMIEAFLRAPATSSAREVEHSLEQRILYVPVDDPNVVANVDTPEDYERLAQARVQAP